MSKKIYGLTILLIVYLLATLIGVVTFLGFKELNLNDFLAVLIADVLATIFVWLMGVILKQPQCMIRIGHFKH